MWLQSRMLGSVWLTYCIYRVRIKLITRSEGWRKSSSGQKVRDCWIWFTLSWVTRGCYLHPKATWEFHLKCLPLFFLWHFAADFWSSATAFSLWRCAEQVDLWAAFSKCLLHRVLQLKGSGLKHLNSVTFCHMILWSNILLVLVPKCLG